MKSFDIAMKNETKWLTCSCEAHIKTGILPSVDVTIVIILIVDITSLHVLSH